MARNVNLSDLAPLPDDANLVSGGFVDYAEHNASRRRTQNLVNNMLGSLRDRESMYAGSGQPIAKPQGKLFLDTDDTEWKGYPTPAATTRRQLMNAATAYNQSLSTGGTATFKLGGAIDVDTTSVEGAYQSYTVPANTLNANGAVLSAVCMMDDSGAGALNLGGNVDLNGSTVIATGRGGTVTNSILKTLIVRTAAGTVKAFGFRKDNLDATGSTDLCEGNATASVDLTANVTLEMGTEGNNDANQAMLVKLLP